MPCIKRVSVNHFRNIESVQLEPTRDLNIIYGENGAGKSSLLEALSFLSRGKSYRTNLFRRVIKEDRDQLVLFSEVQESRDSVDTIRLGLEKSRNGDSKFRINGQTIYQSSDLALRLPILVLNNVAFELLSGSTKGRRQFFDWLVFHVKHEFAQAWKDYNRLIKQRNNLLRHDRITYSDISPWDIELAKVGHTIDRLRRECLDLFIPVFNSYLHQCVSTLDNKEVQLGFHWGLKKEGDRDSAENRGYGELFLEQLKDHFHTDTKLGYTSIGPHRAELKILVGRINAGELLSRGQQKTLITALYFANAQVYRDRRGQSPIILFDDLAAELDRPNQGLVLKWIRSLECQAFITCIDHRVLQELISMPVKMFHVEHGQVAAVP